VAILTSAGQDLPNSKDPAGMKRYEGSEIIGYGALMPFGSAYSAINLQQQGWAFLQNSS
jgi:hypothetical protein